MLAGTVPIWLYVRSSGPRLGILWVKAPMQSVRSLRAVLEDELEALRERAEAALLAWLWDRDSQADPDKMARARALELEVDALVERLASLGPRQQQLTVSQFLTRNS